MKSIRLSLVVSFVALVVLAVGTVSWLGYRSTRQSLRDKEQSTRQGLKDKEESTRQLHVARYEERCRQERYLLDEELLAQARTLASLAQLQYQWSRARYQPLYVLGALTTGAGPNAYAALPIWLGEVRGPLADRLHRINATNIQLNEEALNPDVQAPQYFQVNTEWGRAWRSRSMGRHRFPFDAEAFATMPIFDWKADDLQMADGTPVRRIALKVPVMRVRFQVNYVPPPPSRPPSRPSRDRPPFEKPVADGPPVPPPSWPSSPSSERYAERSSPAILIHCASETRQRDLALASWQAALDSELTASKTALDDELAALAGESEQTLAELFDQLLLINLATLAVTLIGSFALVYLGLAPLRRLSEAVSQVSEKDFRLPVDGRRLPSELRPIAQRLARTLEQLRRAFAREKQAAADLSHELRTPLAAMLTLLEVALRKPRAEEEYRELLEECRGSCQQMSQLVERLLTLARLDAGVDALRPQPVDVADLAEQCTALMRPLAEARGLRVSLHRDGDTALRADPSKLREIVTNLLHNAIEYNSPHGSVDLTVARDNGDVRLEVRDTGIGIPAEAREHIFERFYRADPSRQADGLHAGLGLSIVKGYVDLMGGSIAVESRVGQGSTFRVRLPVQHEESDGCQR